MEEDVNEERREMELVFLRGGSIIYLARDNSQEVVEEQGLFCSGSMLDPELGASATHTICNKTASVVNILARIQKCPVQDFPRKIPDSATNVSMRPSPGISVMSKETKLIDLFNSKVKVGLTNSRNDMYEGILRAIDSKMNIYLSNCKQTCYIKPKRDGTDQEKRTLGLTFFPGNNVSYMAVFELNEEKTPDSSIFDNREALPNGVGRNRGISRGSSSAFTPITGLGHAIPFERDNPGINLQRMLIKARGLPHLI